MPELNITVEGKDRADIRATMLGYWRDEQPGTPGNRITYRYNVETLQDGSRIYLNRPAFKNKGCDFVIRCENFNLARTTGNPQPPSHEILVQELETCIAGNSILAERIRNVVWKVFNCEPISPLVAELAPHCQNTLQIERALKLMKWLFIEQDVTYWTETGRWKTFALIEERLGRCQP